MDRNGDNRLRRFTLDRSLSARRAWIEISVKDLNTHLYYQSLSARRAWIEILALDQYLKEQEVALRKESVDRNHKDLTQWFRDYGRSPQGERG